MNSLPWNRSISFVRFVAVARPGRRRRLVSTAIVAACLALALRLEARPPALPPADSVRVAQRDAGERAFHAQFGDWRTEVDVLVDAFSNSARWVAFEGTTVVRPIWDGAANMAHLDVAGPHGRIEGVSLRLYDPVARQWSLHYANRRTGVLTEPVVGSFIDGRGVFSGRTTLAGRSVLVRFVITSAGPDAWRFEQAVSDDGGETWVTNWIATDTRLADHR